MTTEAKRVDAKKDVGKVGGADYLVGQGREKLFTKILEGVCEKKAKCCDPALETLVSLCDFLAEKKSDEAAEAYDAVVSQLSWDTIGSLAVVLQPHSGADESDYVNADLYKEWVRGATTGDNAELANVYYYHPDPLTAYKKHMDTCKKGRGDIEAARNIAWAKASKPTIVQDLAKGYDRLSQSTDLPTLRKSVPRAGVSFRQRSLCEAELRLASAILQDGAGDCINLEAAKRLFARYSLNKPFLLASSTSFTESNTAFFYSTGFMAARSDGFFYAPCARGKVSVSEGITDQDAHICLDFELAKEKKELAKAYDVRAKQLKATLERMNGWMGASKPDAPSADA
jgi:hypothetical protein